MGEKITTFFLESSTSTEQVAFLPSTLSRMRFTEDVGLRSLRSILYLTISVHIQYRLEDKARQLDEVMSSRCDRNAEAYLKRFPFSLGYKDISFNYYSLLQETESTMYSTRRVTSHLDSHMHSFTHEGVNTYQDEQKQKNFHFMDNEIDRMVLSLSGAPSSPPSLPPSSLPRLPDAGRKIWGTAARYLILLMLTDSFPSPS